LAVKRGLGIDPGETNEWRAGAHAKLRDILQDRARGYAADELAAIASFLGATPSRLVAVALDDIVGEVEQINLPGTVFEHPNWRRKLPVGLELLSDNAQFARVAEAFARAGRTPP
jgi:4-alpha-glucanotransferase